MVMLGDEMTRILEEAAEGLAILENEVITAEFDPTDPVSVEAAVAHVESVIGRNWSLHYRLFKVFFASTFCGPRSAVVPTTSFSQRRKI